MPSTVDADSNIATVKHVFLRSEVGKVLSEKHMVKEPRIVFGHVDPISKRPKSLEKSFRTLHWYGSIFLPMKNCVTCISSRHLTHRSILRLDLF